jgi:hypothetical protein
LAKHTRKSGNLAWQILLSSAGWVEYAPPLSRSRAIPVPGLAYASHKQRLPLQVALELPAHLVANPGDLVLKKKQRGRSARCVQLC